ncbi:MAG TPA: STAS domain-containing protein [Bryobacteraceae bacterium]
MASLCTYLPEILKTSEKDLLSSWLILQKAAVRKMSAADEKTLATHSREFLNSLQEVAQSGDLSDIQSTKWSAVRDFLASMAASRAKAGYTPTETATFVFSLKELLFSKIRSQVGDPAAQAAEMWAASTMLDTLGLFVIETYQKTREEVISRQQKELLELSTPVVRLWDNVLALPLIGTLDSSRTQVVMQNLLEAIVSTRSDIAIIDITGVPTVDTLVAQHLLKTVAAARLMGADCIISGIRPQIAQTIIHLGVDLSEVTTKATMADAFQLALKRTGAVISKAK